MKSNTQRHILLCVAGRTPQIITETLYALTQKRHEPVDEIRVITTIDGRNLLLDALLDPERGEFFKFCSDYGIDASEIKFDETTIALLRTPDGRTLEDIRTPQENEYAGNQICEIVRELAHDRDTRIHASAAGGRKTMGIYLTAAMQLFGRAHDTLSHVLVDADFESARDFFYPPPVPRELTTRDGRRVSTDDAEIHLAEVPFIRLRGVSTSALHSDCARLYNEIVESAQSVLDVIESEYELVVDLRRDTLNIKGQQIKLTSREMFFYTMFADFRLATPPNKGTIAIDKLQVGDLAKTFDHIMQALGESYEWQDAPTYPKFSFLEKMSKLLQSDKARDYEEFKKELSIIISRIKKNIAEHGFDERYAITLRGERGTGRYGIALAPKHIKFAQAES